MSKSGGQLYELEVVILSEQKQVKKQMSKKIALSTMTATMAVSGILPTIANLPIQANAQTVQSVKEPTNVLVKKNDGTSISVDWSANENPEGTEYYLVATPKDEKNVRVTAPLDLQLNGWALNSRPYFETTNTAWYQTSLTQRGDNTISFRTSIPEHATNAAFSVKTLTRSNDILAIEIDGKEVERVNGYTGGIIRSKALTPGEHDIKIVYKNTGDTNYAGQSFVNDIKVQYDLKNSVTSDWVTGTEYTFDNLNPDKDYDVRIIAKNGNERTAMKLSDNATQIQSEAVPSGTSLTWTSSLEGAISYQVLRAGKEVYAGRDKTFIDEEVVGRNKYRYLINTIDINGEIIGSMYKDVLTPEYANITGTPGVNGAKLEWDYTKEATTVDKYQVFRGEEKVYEGTNQEFLDAGAMGGSKYNYTLKVLSTDGVLETDTLTMDMPINPPSRVILTKNDPTEKVVQWSHNHNNSETEYKAIAKPAGAIKKEVKFEQNLNGLSFPASMNFKMSNNWRTVVPYWWTQNTTDLWYEPTDYAGINTMSFDTEIPLTATNAKFSMAYSSVSNDVLEIKVDGVRKWSVVGYNRTGNPKLMTSVDLTPGKKHKIEIIFNNTNNNGDYGGTSFVDDLKVSYQHDGSLESDWTKSSEYTFTGLDASKEYELSVQARNQSAQTAPVAGVSSTQLELTNETGRVEAKFDYLLEGVSSYELLRDGVSIYTGTDANFTDEDTLGSKTYKYELVAKDSSGTTLGSTSKTLVTPNYVSSQLEQSSGNVSLEMDYAKEEAVSYQVIRNGVVLYEDANQKFVDKTTRGATDYQYVVNVKNAEGETLGTKMTAIKTPIATPTKLSVENTSATSLLASWQDDKNPDNTEYKVVATPVGEQGGANLTLFDGFETTLSPFTKVGNWIQTSLIKKTGGFALKSAVIGHSSVTRQTYTINIPQNVNDAKLSYDYKVSSESNYDFFRADLNGVMISRDSGEVNWKTMLKTLKPGVNTLVFEYSKDSSASAGQDAAFIDNLNVEYTNSNIKDSGWVKGKSISLTGLQADKEYDVTIVAKANALESAPILMNNNVLEEATTGVTALETDMNDLDLTKLENIEEAQRLFDEINTIVDSLPEGEEKTELIEKLTAIQSIIDEAKDVVQATEAVKELSLPESFESSTELEAMKNALADAQTKIEAVEAGDVKETLQSQLDEKKTAVAEKEAVFHATESVKSIENLADTIQSREDLTTAKSELVDAKTLVDGLPEGTVRTNLQENLQTIEDILLEAEHVLDATESVDALKATIDAVESLSDVEAAKTLVDESGKMIALLPDGETKDELTTALDTSKEALLKTENILLANKEVDELESSVTSLKSDEDVALAKAELQQAQERLTLLEAGTLKDALEVRIAEAVTLIKTAESVLQAKASVATMIQTATSDSLEKARADVEKVPNSDIKTELMKQVGEMQSVLAMKQRLEQIAKTDYQKLTELDAVIVELDDIETHIKAIPVTSAGAGQKTLLLDLLKKAEQHVNRELTGVLQVTKKERAKTPLVQDTLEFLVEQTIEKSLLTVVKDRFGGIFKFLPSFVENIYDHFNRGAVMGELQPLVGKTVTGKYLNDLIDMYLDGR